MYNRYANQLIPDEIKVDFEEDNSNDAEIIKELRKAMETKKTLSGYCVQALEDGTLEIKLGNNIRGFIPREEVTYKVEKDGQVHLGKCQNRVGLFVSFKVRGLKQEDNGEIVVALSRKAAVIEVNERYAKDLKVGDVLEGVITGMQPYGAFVDIGGDVSGIVAVRDITKVIISHPSEAIKLGQRVTVVLKSVDKKPDGSLTVTFSREQLLPGWEDIDKYYKQGATVVGKVKNIWDTGVFVELSESFEGLADFVPGRTFKYGEKVRVKIDVINKERQKIKLRIVG